MRFPQAETLEAADAAELIAELTLLVEHPDAPGAELACDELAALAQRCENVAVAADAEELLAQVIVLRHAATRLPLAG